MSKSKYPIPVAEDNDGLVQARVPKKHIYYLKANGVKIPALIRAAIRSAINDLKDK